MNQEIFKMSYMRKFEVNLNNVTIDEQIKQFIRAAVIENFNETMSTATLRSYYDGALKKARRQEMDSLEKEITEKKRKLDALRNQERFFDDAGDLDISQIIVLNEQTNEPANEGKNETETIPEDDEDMFKNNQE